LVYLNIKTEITPNGSPKNIFSMNELERILTASNLKMAATVIILFAAIYSFVKEKN